MRRALRPWGLFVATALVLASLGLALAEDAFFHTDDGCVVETHCVACLWHHGAVVVSPTVVALPTSVAPAEAIVAPENLSPTDAIPRPATSRGPPLA